MKVWYKLSTSESFKVGTMGCTYYDDLRQAFRIAKEVAKEDDFVLLTKVTKDENGRISYKACRVHANGTYSYL